MNVEMTMLIWLSQIAPVIPGVETSWADAASRMGVAALALIGLFLVAKQWLRERKEHKSEIAALVKAHDEHEREIREEYHKDLLAIRAMYESQVVALRDEIHALRAEITALRDKCDECQKQHQAELLAVHKELVEALGRYGKDHGCGQGSA